MQGGILLVLYLTSTFLASNYTDDTTSNIVTIQYIALSVFPYPASYKVISLVWTVSGHV